MTLEEASRKIAEISMKLDDTKEAEIVEFLHRRFPTDSNWLTGNCYWMACILATRFEL